MSAEPVRVSVGQLADTCRRGDINFCFASRSSALEGIRGHQQVQGQRAGEYLAECPLSLAVSAQGVEFEVHGRADGIERSGGRLCLEEIKTTRVAPEDTPADVLQGYWFQACIYAHMLAFHERLDGLWVRLCLFNLDDASEHLDEKWFSAGELTSLFTEAVCFFAGLVVRQADWRVTRNAALDSAAFPHGTFRPGQRDMAVSVFRTVAAGGQLIMQAPTGIGKTLATLYPAVQGLSSGRANRVFYLTARNSTQALAAKSITDMIGAGAALRAVTITAKDKVCFSPGEPCHPDRCRYARGYYDRVHSVIKHLLDSQGQSGAVFDRHVLAEVARRHEICPFELSLDIANWCDVIVGDYNYAFDPTVYLRRFFDNGARDVVVLVDEAHNLVDRGRAMYSATVNRHDYLTLARQFKSSRPSLSRAAQKVNRAILALKNEDADRFETQQYLCWQSLPGHNTLGALQSFCESAELLLRASDLLPVREKLLTVYFDTLRFLRTADDFDDRYVTVLENTGRQVSLKLNCVDPSTRLQACFARTAASVCFSATLQPQPYFRAMLGVQEQALWYRLASPFDPANLQVTIAAHVDTSWRGRQGSVDEVVELVHAMVSAKRGNYLVFFPSHDYMNQVADVYVARYPETDTVVQARAMDDGARAGFLERFSHDACVCGFSVMGGIFAEGIDLKGNRLIGVMIIGVGLPQMGVERDLIREHFEVDGFDYAYRYPGLVRVLQTAGRVIRDETDRGVVCLVDRRFAEPRTRSLLPVEWQPEHCHSTAEVAAVMNTFWQASEADPAGETLQIDPG